MSFVSGKVAFTRYRLKSPRPRAFGQEHLDRIAEHATPRLTGSDGVERGWAAGDSYADLDFTLEKNVYPDHLLWDLVLTTNKLPKDKFRAYYQTELKALSKDNPSGFPSAKQKREAKEIARERLEQEAEDGRFLKRTIVPCCWDVLRNEVWVGTTSAAALVQFETLFEQTFSGDLTQAEVLGELGKPMTAANLAELLDPAAKNINLSSFIKGVTPEDRPRWITFEDDVGFLGNEFLLWLWFQGDTETDTLKLKDGSEATFMFSGGIKLDCPAGQTGHDVLNHDGPNRMPEARRAIQTGKLPRKAGLIIVRHDEQFALHLQAESFAVSACKLPKPEADINGPRAVTEHRLQATRDLCETLDLMFQRFLAIRISGLWASELELMQKWLQRPEKARR